MDRRDFVVLNLPISSDEPIPHPEKVIIQFSNKRSHDLGALCYLDREGTGSRGHNLRTAKNFRSRPVDLRSFRPGRTKHIEKLIRYFSEQVSDSGKRLRTIGDSVSRFLAFMDWADQNDYTDALDAVDPAKTAFHNYLIHLVARVRLEEIDINTASAHREKMTALFCEYFDVSDFSRGLPRVLFRVSKKNTTSPPDEKRTSEVLILCQRLFASISEFVCDFKQYPHSIVVPTHYKYPNDKLWIFPTINKFKHPSQHSSRGNGSYNFKEGKIYTLEEMKKKSPQSEEWMMKSSIAKAYRNVNSANTDQFHQSRIYLAQLALHCFVILFQAETGMNWSQVMGLEWTGHYEVESPRQLFRAIKWRADNREVYFEIANSFLPKFKNFLKLRKYLLKDSEFPFLFFQSPAGRQPIQLADTQVSAYLTLKRIYPGLTLIKNREWRAAKSDWLITNTDPSTAALVLQNSEQTVLSHYSAGSEKKQILEFGEFLNDLSKSVLKKREGPSGAVDRSIGICSDYLSPSQSVPVKNISSNCTNLEGCFFCEKYRVHADEIDTRKLLSCRYCLEKVSPNFQGEEHYETTIQPLLNRINALLKMISEKDPKLVDDVSKSVELNGELEFYWAQKFQMLLELEVIE